MELRRYFSVIKRRWWLLIMGMIIPMSISYYFVSRQPVLYQARVTLRPDVEPKTAYAVLVKRRPITQAVIQRLNLEKAPEELAGQITAWISPEAQLLEIMVTDTSPQAAALTANALADELIRQDLRDNLTLVEPAVEPTEPISGRSKLILPVAGAVGLALAAVFVILAECLASRVQDLGAGLRSKIGVLLILIVVALVSSLGSLLWGNQEWDGLALNFGTEMAGAVVTYALLELFIGGRERREAKKADLIAQMGSSVKDVAIAAVEELGRHGWLYDGSLRGAYLLRANLQGVELQGANLEEAFLSEANLVGAILMGANLKRADLFRANLEEAFLPAARLQRANLHLANLQGADLGGANVQEAQFDENTVLPNGTKWTPDTDMARFTDPDHPDFWRPDA